jgi:hypothetical protein
MPTSCFSKALQSPKKASTEDEKEDKELKPINENLVEKFIIDNPMIFRICCLCVVRRRMRVVAADDKQNGHANHNDSDDNIEFTRSSTLALDDIVDEK